MRAHGHEAEAEQRETTGDQGRAEDVDAAIARIEHQLMATAAREVASQQVGELVIRELRKLDKIAYVRFASVYRSFKDVGEFAEAIQEVRPDGS